MKTIILSEFVCQFLLFSTIGKIVRILISIWKCKLIMIHWYICHSSSIKSRNDQVQFYEHIYIYVCFYVYIYNLMIETHLIIHFVIQKNICKYIYIYIYMNVCFRNVQRVWQYMTMMSPTFDLFWHASFFIIVFLRITIWKTEDR